MALGYGRKRRVVRRRPLKPRAIGGSLRSMLSATHKYIKSRKLVFGALTHFGHSKLASAASSLGYGRRRRRPVRRHRGGAFFTPQQIAMPRFS